MTHSRSSTQTASDRGPVAEATRDRLLRLRGREHFVIPPHAIPDYFRRAAVLVPFWEQDGEVRVLLTRRAASLSRNAGEISFPGGLLEGRESWEEAALREAEEEVGLARHRVELLGRLDDAWSGTGSHLASLVGWLDAAPELVANEAEVSEILTPSVRELLEPGAISYREIVKRGTRYINPTVEWPGARAYGLSADLLIEALGWATGEVVERGPARLADLESQREVLVPR
jgi:8-oxo-dGTP pyrophosphatase MutT (NUDIX family)